MEVANQKPPDIGELKKSRFYFSELQDALTHYSTPPGMSFDTIAIRTNIEGKPYSEVVSETRFPPLDDLPTHLSRLQEV